MGTYNFEAIRDHFAFREIYQKAGSFLAPQPPTQENYTLEVEQLQSSLREVDNAFCKLGQRQWSEQIYNSIRSTLLHAMRQIHFAKQGIFFKQKNKIWEGKTVTHFQLPTFSKKRDLSAAPAIVQNVKGIQEVMTEAICHLHGLIKIFDDIARKEGLLEKEALPESKT